MQARDSCLKDLVPMISRPLLALALLSAAGLAAPAMAQPATTPPAEARNGSQPNDGDKVLNSAEKIAEKPFRDFNIIKDKVPPELELAMEDPYSTAGLRTCRQFTAEIRKMDAVLRPDVDSAEARAERKDRTPGEYALVGVEAVAGSLIPFAGLIRIVTGAEKRQAYVRAAVLAGSLRRAHLKGHAMAKGCRMDIAAPSDHKIEKRKLPAAR
jgi:hypothetical protein